MKTLLSVKQELDKLFAFHKSRPHSRDNLTFLLRYAIKGVDDVIKYYGRFGADRKDDEQDDPKENESDPL